VTEKEWGVYKCGKSALRRTNVAMWDEGGGAVGAVVSVLGVVAVMASGVDASGCAVASYETTSADVPPFADNNFMVSSETSLSGVQTMTLSNNYQVHLEHFSMTTPWALGYAVFSYTGIYDIASPPTTDYATATFVGLIPGAAYHVQSWNYLQYNWGGIGHHQGEFMFSVNGGDLERVTVVAQPTSTTNTALSPSVSKTVVARADGTIELKFMRDHLLPSKSAACSNYDPPLANCKADGRHLPLSGLSILPVCQAPPASCDTGGGVSLFSYWSIRKC
tara:strand:+ start:7260 stop:8090 length:831 start_codon:yes stop_codon:yes gene_type:complete